MKSTRCSTPLNVSEAESRAKAVGETFRALRRGLKRSRGFALYVAICNSLLTRDELIANLSASMPDKVVHRVVLTTKDEDVLAAVEKVIGKSTAGVVMVVGVEQLLADKVRAERLLAGLNLRRAEWPSRVCRPVVFWLPQRFLGDLMRGAPDFFDWRSDTLEFPELTTEQARPLASREWQDGPDPRFTAEERLARIAELRARIAAIANPSDDPAIISSVALWWDELADHLSLMGELDEALRILKDQLPVFERLGDVRERAITQGKIADILQARGQLDEALRIRTEEELPVYERLGDVREQLVCRANTALIYWQRGSNGDREKALALLHLALADTERLQIPEAQLIAALIQQVENPSIGQKATAQAVAK